MTEAGLTDAFLLENVTPHTTLAFGDSVGRCLGKALLWAIFNDDCRSLVGADMVDRVRGMVHNLLGDEERDQRMRNPIERIPLVVSGSDGQLYIDEMVGHTVDDDEEMGNDNAGDDGNGGEGGAGDGGQDGTADRVENRRRGGDRRGVPAHVARHQEQEQMLAVYSQIANLNRQCCEIKAELEALKATQNDNLRRIHSSIRKIHQFPVLRRHHMGATRQGGGAAGRGGGGGAAGRGRGGGAAGGGGAGAEGGGSDEEDANADLVLDHRRVMPKLMKCPKTINVIWMEYEFGIDGKKPAKLYTSEERGANRFAYSRRKVVWDKIKELIRAGYSSHTAIDRIYEAYPNMNVTQMINQMRKDKEQGGHELLAMV